MKIAIALALVATAARADTPTLAITNGTPTTAYPAVVAILRAGDPTCTGTLITSRVVLTAAHCLARDVSQLSVYIGSGRDVDPGSVIRVADAKRHPGYAPSTLAHDIGLLYLEREAPVQPMPLFAGLWDDSFVGRSLHVVGFGSPVSGDASTHVKRHGLAYIASFDASHLVLNAAPSQTCAGDSGGPAFLTIDGNDVLVGVTSYGDHDCQAFGADIRVDQYAERLVGPFIAAHSRTNRDAGELCQVDDHCASRRCELASESDSIRYCTEACDGDVDCPTGMRCRGDRCVWQTEGPAALGAPCERDDSCASNICADIDGDLQCAAWCAPGTPGLCPSDACRGNPADPGTFVCGPAEPLVAGCDASAGGSGVLLLLMAAACTLVAPRRARRGSV